jgi:shikimate kinase
MNTPNNIFLIGPMGAGKSTIGRRLAKALQKTFYDSDHEIERSTGVDIPLIFELEGEPGFRKREKKIIDQLSIQNNIVLATGGGAILAPENRKNLASRGMVIYLSTSIQQQFSRTHRDQNRPLLQTNEPEQRLRELMETRDPLYREIAEVIVDTDGRSVFMVTNEILKILGMPPLRGSRSSQ